MAKWVEDIIQAMKNLGGQAAYFQIYEEVKRIRKEPLPESWKSVIQGTIETYSSDSMKFNGKDYFHKISKGVWALRGQEGIRLSTQSRITKPFKSHEDFMPSESFETIANCLRTIKEYRDFSDPTSATWIEYIQEFFHILGFGTETQESRLLFLKDMGSNSTLKAVVGIVLPGENFEEISPGIRWESHLRYAANYYHIAWGIITDGLQLKIFDYGNQWDQTPLFWPELDGIIEHEKLDSFFKIHKVFSTIKGHKEEFAQRLYARSKTKVVLQKPNPRLKSPNWSNEVNSVQQFVEFVLKKQFGDGFRKLGRSYMYESDSEIIYFQNSNVDKDEWWYRVLKNARQYLASSKKQSWLCLTNIPMKIVYIFPMKAVEEQARHSGWKRDELEITIYPQRSWWHQLKWDIEEYRYDLR